MKNFLKIFLVMMLLLLSGVASAQNTIEWNENYELQLSDFQSTSTKIGADIYSLQSSCGISYAVQMSNAEFMFTKNFNSKVNCKFTRDAASLIAPDSATALSLVKFARYSFDLAELYARKFRKKLYEGKNTFSDVTFLQPAYEEIQKEFVARHSLAGDETNLGRAETKLAVLHSEVIREIKELPDFCKTCKPKKKKKKKNNTD